MQILRGIVEAAFEKVRQTFAIIFKMDAILTYFAKFNHQSFLYQTRNSTFPSVAVYRIRYVHQSSSFRTLLLGKRCEDTCSECKWTDLMQETRSCLFLAKLWLEI
jgi:hypothetical protein